MDIAAIIISVIALAISVVDIYNNSRLNKINLESQYFDDLYKDYLLNEIPQSRKKITFNNEGRLTGTDDLIKVLSNIRSGSAYFLYTDEDFYYELKSQLQELEDYILKAEEKTFLCKEDQSVETKQRNMVFEEIGNRIVSLYSLMTQKCFGSKSNKLINCGKFKKLLKNFHKK